MCVWRPLHLIVCLVVSFDCVILSFDSVAEVKPTEAWLEQVSCGGICVSACNFSSCEHQVSCSICAWAGQMPWWSRLPFVFLSKAQWGGVQTWNRSAMMLSMSRSINSTRLNIGQTLSLTFSLTCSILFGKFRKFLRPSRDT